jgi:hypothetical protein
MKKILFHSLIFLELRNLGNLNAKSVEQKRVLVLLIYELVIQVAKDAQTSEAEVSAD